MLKTNKSNAHLLLKTSDKYLGNTYSMDPSADLYK